MEDGYWIDCMCHLDVGADVAGNLEWKEKIQSVVKEVLRKDLKAQLGNIDDVVVKIVSPAEGTTVFYVSAIAGNKEFLSRWKDVTLREPPPGVYTMAVAFKGSGSVSTIPTGSLGSH